MSKQANRRTDRNKSDSDENQVAEISYESDAFIAENNSSVCKKIKRRAANIYTFILFTKNLGIKKTLLITQSKLGAKKRIRKMLFPDLAELQLQRDTVFNYSPLISIIAPLYNSDIGLLAEAIDSVKTQTYPNWELILVDASEERYRDVGLLCQQYAQDDARILYIRLTKNLGISGNTNLGFTESSGDYITLLDHDDLLHQSALFEVVNVINNDEADLIYTDELNILNTFDNGYYPHFKPDFSPDTLRSYNYICHMMVFSKTLLDKCGRMRNEYSGSQDYDLALRLSEHAERIIHIPKLLYFWRIQAQSFSHDKQKRLLCIEAAKNALRDHLIRVGMPGEIFDASVSTSYRIKYELVDKPLVSIIIPNYNHASDLKNCIDSILAKSSYSNFEIIVVENNSTDPEVFEYYQQLVNPRISVLYYKNEFNFSAINNYASNYAKGEYLLFLNNDTEIITPEWIEEMLMYAQRKDIGAVGAMLYYPDDTVQHAGVILGIGGTAGHVHRGFKRGETGYSNRLKITQNISAVTGACLMISKTKFVQVDGFTESFVVALNDVDLCLKLRAEGYLNVFTPFAELYHFESKSRGYEDNREKKARFEGETLRFHQKWDSVLALGDPYYNPNLTLYLEDFSIG